MAFDPTETRDSHGRWTRGASGEVSTELDQRVLDVSGDEWNKSTAKRLEQEYALVRPELDKIAQKAVEGEVEVDGRNAESWEDLSGSTQEDAGQQYYEQNYSHNHDNEIESWLENGEGINAAKHNLADDEEFKADFIADFLDERDQDSEHIPYTAEELTKALVITPDEEGGDPHVEFDRDFLSEPDNLNPNYSPDQMKLPGIDVPDVNPSDKFTATIENDLRDALIEAFNSKAESKAGDIEPPDYLADSAKEYTESSWDNMDDEEKYDWAKNNTDLIANSADEDSGGKRVEMPDVFDPLNKTSGEDYKRTQALAKYIADERAAQIITERTDAGTIGGKGWKPRSAFLGDDASYEKLYGPGGVGAKKDADWTERMRKEMQRVDTELWSGWKSTSTGEAGKLLQVATAEELGGRLREEKPKEPTHNMAEVALAHISLNDPNSSPGLKADAQKIIDAVAGDNNKYFGHMTNFADSKAWAKHLKADPTSSETVKQHAAEYLVKHQFDVDDIEKTKTEKSEIIGDYIRLPGLNVVRNGAASTTASREVANGWGGTQNYAPSGINKKEVIKYANENYKSIGGYEGVKAAIRAKWETTQYLLDRAGLAVVQVYRGINLPHTPDKAPSNTGDFNAPTSGIVEGFKIGNADGSGKVDLKTAKLGEQIKTKSGKTITKTDETDGPYSGSVGAGQWKYNEPPREASRVVLRAELPRTAVVSVPAYGINVKSEQELVVAGTAWKNWDAWSGRAPSFAEVPMNATAHDLTDEERRKRIAKTWE
jgi:acyl-CoA-binding protein